MHLPDPQGRVRTVSVYEAVNVSTHPHLRDAALTGRLHVFADGPPLAVPFVYHDPGALLFALVVPPVLRHQFLELRAALWRDLSECRDVVVPSYVLRFAVVLGHEGLRAWVASAALPSTQLNPTMRGVTAPPSAITIGPEDAEYAAAVVGAESTGASEPLPVEDGLVSQVEIHEGPGDAMAFGDDDEASVSEDEVEDWFDADDNPGTGASSEPRTP